MLPGGGNAVAKAPRYEPAAPPHAWEDPAVIGIDRLPGRSVIAGRAGLDPQESDDDYRLNLSGEWTFDWYQGTGDQDPVALGRAGARSLAGSVCRAFGNCRGTGRRTTWPTRIRRRWGAVGGRIPDIDPTPTRSVCRPVPSAPPPAGSTVGPRSSLRASRPGCTCSSTASSPGTPRVLPGGRVRHPALVTPGDNTVTAVVYRYTDGSYLEDQDMWFFSGVFRPVWLNSEPVNAVRDLWCAPRSRPLGPGGRSGARSTCTSRPTSDATWGGGLPAASGATEWILAAATDLDAGRDRVELTVPVPEPLLWSAETPPPLRGRRGPDVG